MSSKEGSGGGAWSGRGRGSSSSSSSESGGGGGGADSIDDPRNFLSHSSTLSSSFSLFSIFFSSDPLPIEGGGEIDGVETEETEGAGADGEGLGEGSAGPKRSSYSDEVLVSTLTALGAVDGNDD